MYETNYRIGDVSNGHVLTENGWVPIGHANVIHVAPRPTTYPGRGLAIAGMVLGIVAWGLALLTVFVLSPISFVLALVGLPLSAVGYRQSAQAGAPTGIGIAGVALNAVGLALAALLFFFFVVSAASA